MSLGSFGEVIDFCRRLIRTPSPSGAEGEVAQIIQEEMKRLGYDEVWTDEVGNVIGLIRGKMRSPAVMFTTHMDHVDPGDETRWAFPPYGAEMRDGYIYGRGASDAKGAIATQIYLKALLEGPPPSDIFMAYVVMEEVGGLGTRHLLTYLRPDVVILGEPTGNELRIGHRGRMELIVEAHGRAAHASMPSKGKNPHYPMASFLLRLKDLPMEEGGGFTSSVAPTLYYTDQSSGNVIPARATLHVDWRTIPGQGEGEVVRRLQSILEAGMEVRVRRELMKTYTGREIELDVVHPPFYLDPHAEVVEKAKAAIEGALGRPIGVGPWSFTTDAGFFQREGIPVLGFSPCEEQYAHTYEDRVSITMLEEALRCYPALVEILAG